MGVFVAETDIKHDGKTVAAGTTVTASDFDGEDTFNELVANGAVRVSTPDEAKQLGEAAAARQASLTEADRVQAEQTAQDRLLALRSLESDIKRQEEELSEKREQLAAQIKTQEMIVKQQKADAAKTETEAKSEAKTTTTAGAGSA